MTERNELGLRKTMRTLTKYGMNSYLYVRNQIPECGDSILFQRLHSSSKTDAQPVKLTCAQRISDMFVIRYKQMNQGFTNWVRTHMDRGQLGRKLFFKSNV